MRFYELERLEKKYFNLPHNYQVTPFTLAFFMSAPLRLAPFRSAPVKSTFSRLAPLKSTFSRVAPLKLALVRIAPRKLLEVRVAPLIFALFMITSLKLDEFRLACFKLTPPTLMPFNWIIGPLVVCVSAEIRPTSCKNCRIVPRRSASDFKAFSTATVFV